MVKWKHLAKKVIGTIQIFNEPKEISGDTVLKLQTILSNKDLVVSDAILKCMEIIMKFNYTSVVSQG